jgi:propanol-preferring alcohol dehydrogenase
MVRAMVLAEPAPVDRSPLEHRELPDPRPAADEVVVEVSVCAVCRTDLHVVEGELERRRSPLIPGHQVVGHVIERGAQAHRFPLGARVGVAWLHRTCERCDPCRRGEENLCEAPEFTGWTVDGGYAERVRVPEAFAYAIPDGIRDLEVAPLLCAGIIGYRALERSRIEPGGRLGLYGFGSSAHIALQVARHRGCRVYVCTRDPAHRALALELGAEWAGAAEEAPPSPLDAAILFAPAGALVPVALRALAPGGTLACAGIYMSEIPPLDYARELFQERTLTSVAANTRADGRALLDLAAEIPLRPRTTAFELREANEALLALARDRISGSAALVVRR